MSRAKESVLCELEILVQRELVKIRYRWTEADTSNDNELDIDEFLIFRHPEITGHSYKYVVEDIILQMGPSSLSLSLLLLTSPSSSSFRSKRRSETDDR